MSKLDEVARGRAAYSHLAEAVDEAWEDSEGRATTFWNDGWVFCLLEEYRGLTLLVADGHEVRQIVLCRENLHIAHEAIARILAPVPAPKANCGGSE